MEMHYPILHISDLHKPENCNLDNLFYSIQTDCTAYIAGGICKPEIINIKGGQLKFSVRFDSVTQ